MKTQAQISAIIEELKQLYPDALCLSLIHI